MRARFGAHRARKRRGSELHQCFQVGDRIRAWRSADWFLINEPDAGQMFDPFNRAKLAHWQ